MGKKLRSFITLEFGNPVQSTEVSISRSAGDWHLWIYCCAWRLGEGNLVLASSEDPRPKLELAVKRMEGLTLDFVEVLPPAWDTVFMFSEQVIPFLYEDAHYYS